MRRKDFVLPLPSSSSGIKEGMEGKDPRLLSCSFTRHGHRGLFVSGSFSPL